jgi:hypothetical protein
MLLPPMPIKCICFIFGDVKIFMFSKCNTPCFALKRCEYIKIIHYFFEKVKV